MGKGDQKSRRGKIQVGSFGNLRPRKKAKTTTAKAKTEVAEKKAAPKKAAAKKAAK
ncbi:MAG: 30S ribosomal protein THX [Bacteroidota bacterium]